MYPSSFEISVPLIADIGEHSLRLGLQSDDGPKVTLPTIIGYPTGTLPSLKPYYVGLEVYSIPSVKSVIRPIEHGHIKDLDNLTKILHHAFFSLLKINPIQQRVLVSTHSVRTEKENYFLLELMFEIFGTPAAFIANSSFLALLAHKKLTGLIVDIGNSTIRISPYFEGYKVSNGVVSLNYGGEIVSRYLEQLLREKGIYLKHKKMKSWLEETVKEHCYVALDNKKEELVLKKNPQMERECLFIDSTILKLKHERYLAAEALFNPELAGIPELPLIEGIVQSIKNCDISIRKELWQNILISGSIADLPGFIQRLHKELKDIVEIDIDIKIPECSKRGLLTWCGGRIFASINSFKEYWITIADYKKEGTNVLSHVFD